MSRRRYKIGDKFDFLTIEGRVKGVNGRNKYLCRCVCGGTKLVDYGHDLNVGKVIDCGCGIHRTVKAYHNFLDTYQDQLQKAGILYVSVEQFKNDKIPYRCPIHKEARLVSKASLRKFKHAPCFKCGKAMAAKERLKTTEQFIEDAKKVWGDMWDYSKTEYTGCHDSLIVTCPTHGDFTQAATDHLSGFNACKGCSPRQGFDKNKSGWLYLVRWSDGEDVFLKFGITNKPVESRVRKQATRRANIVYEPEILNTFFYEDGHDCADMEFEIHKSFETGVVDKEDFPDGFSETTDINNLEEILKLIHA